MKAIHRKIDALGRVTLPSQLRRNLNLELGDSVDIYEENGKIIVQSHVKSCVFCENTEDLKEFNKQMICRKCIEMLKNS